MTSLKGQIRASELFVSYDPIHESISANKQERLLNQLVNKITMELEEHMKHNPFWDYDTHSVWQNDGYEFAKQKMLKFLKGETT